MNSHLCNPEAWAQNKRVAVIGGSSGIGGEAARLLSSLGATVILGGRSIEALETMQASLSSTTSIAVDISKERDVARFFGECGELDHLFVTAGSVVYELLDDGPLDRFQSIIDSRILGALAIGKYAQPCFGTSGSITFTSGAFAVRPRANTTAVAAGVGGVEALARGLALELAPIRVNTVRYGIVETEATARRFGADKQQYLARMGKANPLGRVGTATEAAEAAMFLMMNGYINGTVLTVDGGWTTGQWP